MLEGKNSLDFLSASIVRVMDGKRRFSFKITVYPWI
jgi:hypothetical protein